ncbi:MAG: alpha/beta fold hydrolase [Acutalibacteraceae bacterium]|nr:alpha/beta fold hydrolase [Clostridia bacterium]MEE1292579.1 alpha/beta fold hydrolase [Acutalibacteraceae bacterium]MEE3374150.1 alpha/beta fold hydrolase [Acutalibacteraceae bacterium]NLD29389.1 alpha/beta fold hydrolase [Clostridiales bacterium]
MATKKAHIDPTFKEFCVDKVAWGSFAVSGQKFEQKPTATFKAVAYDGVTIASKLWKASGEERILLCVHGYGSDGVSDFKNLIPGLLAKGTSVCTMDLRNHGESDCGEKAFTMWGVKEKFDVVATLWELDRSYNGAGKPIYVYGKDLGAAAALYANMRALPGNVKGFILEDPIEEAMVAMPYILKKATGKGEHEYNALEDYLNDTFRQDAVSSNSDALWRLCQRPALFLQSMKNDQFPKNWVSDLCTAYPKKSTLVSFPEAKLDGCYDSDAETFRNAVDTFFAENDSLVFDDEVHIAYPDKTMYEMLKMARDRLPNKAAYMFQGAPTTFDEMHEHILMIAAAFEAHGVKKGDTVTLCMPNIPQAIETLYALNRIGVTVSLIHPLSAEKEIVHYLTLSESKAVLVPDLFYDKVLAATEEIDRPIDIIVARMQDYLKFPLNVGFWATQGRKFTKYPLKGKGTAWKDYMKAGQGKAPSLVPYEEGRTAIILYSGGSTGAPKGILLSDKNFNALALQCAVAIDFDFFRDLRFLAAMPVFHGFGLGVGIHTILINGGCDVLIPTVNTKSYSEAMQKFHPNLIAGVPTLFKMLIESEYMKDADVSYLMGMFSGGDSIPVPLKREVDKWLKEHGASIQVREGYGLTETVTASCLTPRTKYKEGSIGVGYPDTTYKIVKPGTEEFLSAGEEGEIAIQGPSVMLGYKDQPEETAKTLVQHSNGEVWLHTGDLGHMDEENFVYFHQRMKRMIITSGYNVSPAQIEGAINELDYVDYCCVIGVQDDYKMQRIKAFVVLKDGVEGTDELKKQIVNECRKSVAGYALPREIEFRSELPKTLVGKVAFHALEEEENAKVAAAKKAAAEEKK